MSSASIKAKYQKRKSNDKLALMKISNDLKQQKRRYSIKKIAARVGVLH